MQTTCGNGVLSPVPGVIGTMMAVEALKHLAGLDVESGVLNVYDALSTEWRKLKVKKRRKCPACAV